jgi:hypothetical protein
MTTTTELLSRWWLFLTVPGCLVGIGILVTGIVLLLHTIHVPELARLPLIAEQDFDLKDGGPLMFAVEKPRFRNVQANALNPFGLSVSLEDVAGQVEQARRVLMPATVEGLSRTRVDVASLSSSRPGRYRLRVAGLAPDFDITGTFVVITRPVSKSTLVLSILFIIAGAALALGSLIASVATLVKFQYG